MGRSKMSEIVLLLALGVLVVVFALGRALTEWEWWTFLLVLASLAFAVGLVLFLVRRVLR